MNLAEEIHGRICERSTSDSVDPRDLDSEIRQLVCELAPLTTRDDRTRIIAEVKARVDGLGPLHVFGVDPAVSEIMVNGGGEVWVERVGVLECTDLVLGPDEVHHLIRRLSARAGRRIDAMRPSVDVRLDDGSRLHAIVPPLAVDGPCVTIRRFRPQRLTLDELADSEAGELLRTAVGERRTIIVGGGTSSGKTTLLNALGSSIDAHERTITIEDAAELSLPGEHVVRLETRPAVEGAPAIDLRELVRNALRMRPDRIICGEMRGSEALDLIQAMNTGHEGSLSTVHANGPSDVLRRIETMMLTADADLPLQAIRDQLAACIDMVVMMARTADGSRCVVSIDAVPDEPSVGWQLERRYRR